MLNKTSKLCLLIAAISMISWSLWPYSVHADITSNLVSWYKFDEANTGNCTTTTADSGSANNTATCINSPAYGPGHIGVGLLTLNPASGNYLTTSDASDYNFTSTNFTISAWIKTTNPADTIFTTIAPASYIGWEFAISQGSSSINPGLLSFYNGSSWQSATGRVDDGAWHMVSMTYDGTNVVFYTDGAVTQTVAMTAPLYGSTPLWLGRRNDGGFPQNFGGNIDDVRIYTRKLSSTDITQLYAYTGATHKNNMLMAENY